MVRVALGEKHVSDVTRGPSDTKLRTNGDTTLLMWHLYRTCSESIHHLGGAF